MTAPSENLAPQPPRRRRRRWLLRIPIILIALLVTIVVLVQAFLCTDYPRRIAEAQVERILHVRTDIKSVSIGWMGRTRIEGVALTLPMEREPFLRVASIDARHASLPLIAFTQDLSDVRVDGVTLTARQEASGRWNVEQLIAPSSGKPPADPAARRPSNPLAELPSLHAHDVRATLIRNDGKRLDLPVLEAELRKPDALTASLVATAGDVVRIDGEIGQSAALPQSIHAQLSHVPQDVAAFFGIAKPPAISADVRWEGRLTGTGVAGSLQMVDVRAEKARAVGRVDLELSEGGKLVARPTDVKVTVDEGKILDAHATSGTITFQKNLTLDRLAGTVNGGRFAVNGTLEPAMLASDLTANWEQVTRDSIASTGSARIRTAKLFNGSIQVDATARGGVKLPAGEAIGALEISGAGPSVDAFAATLKLDPFTWTPADRGPPIVTPRLEGTASLAGTTARLEARAPGDPRARSLVAYAGGDRITQQWWANVAVSELRLPELEARGIKGPIDLSVAARGVGTRVELDEAYVKVEKGSAYAQGRGDLGGAQPVRVAAWAWYDKPVTEDEAAQLNSLRLISTIEGTLTPRDLKADVEVLGTELVFAQRRIGDVALQVSGGAGEDEAWLQSKELEAFGGHFSVRGGWSAMAGGPPTVVVNFRDVPLANLGELVDRDDLGGQIDAGSATFRIRSSRLDQLEMTAVAHGNALAAGPFKAESLDLAATLRAGQFEVRPTLREQGGTLTAEVVGDVRLAAPVRARVTLEEWPAPYVMSTAAGAERFRPRASGTAGAELSLATGDMSGEVALGGIIERGESKLADFRVEGELKRKLISITRFTLDTLDGTLAATAKLDLANYNATVVDATFDNLTPARLAWSNPMIGELEGRVNGTFAIRPSVTPRAMGPMELELNVRPEAMAFRGVRVGDMDLLAYADVKTPEAFRVVTDRAVLHVAGGRIEPFARLSNEPGRGLAQLVTANFRDIDLAELSRAADSDGKDVSGLVAGRVQLYGQTTNIATLTGDATLEITRSDLANFGPISALYNALAVGTAGSEPNGEGSISLRVGGDALTIDDASYFNRGVYANAFGSVRGLSRTTDAEVDHALVVGSLQPLRAVKLPFFGDVNDTLAALQSSLTAIDVSGTLKEPKMQQVSVSALSEGFQKVLLGKTRGDK